jgi:hypothetical protein
MKAAQWPQVLRTEETGQALVNQHDAVRSGKPIAQGAALAGLVIGGGGGCVLQSMYFQTASTTKAVMMAATICCLRNNLFGERIDSFGQAKIEIS